MARQLGDAIKRFDTFLRVERNLAPRTCEAYNYDLTRFESWMSERDQELLFLENINPDDARDYLAHLHSRHEYSSSALCRILSAMRQFFKFCVDRGFLETSPIETLRNPKKTKKLPIFLIENDLKRLLAAPDPSDFRGCRDYCLLVLMGMTGVRLKEIVGLDVVDFDREAETIKVTGKGRKERLIPLNALASSALELYISIRPTVADRSLFLNKFGSRLSGRMVEKLVKKYCLQAGISQNGVSPHKLRHTFATLLHVNNVDLLEIQKLLGHASILSTQIYTHTNTSRLRTAVDKISL